MLPAAADEVPVNTTTAGTQQLPSLAADEDGNVVVVWESDGQDGRRFDGHGDDVCFTGAVDKLQLYRRALSQAEVAFVHNTEPPPLFIDGFESGDASLWSNAVP